MEFDSFEWPETLAMNAWTGEHSPTAPSVADPVAWAVGGQSSAALGPTMLPEPPDEWDWRHPDIGWGLVLPDNPNLSKPERATAMDAPEPLQELLRHRPGSPVLRWSAQDGFNRVWRYDAQGGRRPFSLTSSKPGIGERQLPMFLLIAAPPSQIPWELQYAAQMSRHVGRLDLQGQALEHYVQALLSGWADSRADARAPLVWSVNHGPRDITWLMQTGIARILHGSYKADKDLSRGVALFDDLATGERLRQALAEQRPGMVVTTSHGKTGPLADAPSMLKQLGVPVDAAHRPLDLDALCADWQPDGAIWYAHACCSAGSDLRSAYEALFEAQSPNGRVLRGVAAGCGACTAPLPTRLLGAKRPLRAFVGCVEPTFDWTLQDPESRQMLTDTLTEAFYKRLYSGGGRPVGWALRKVYQDAGAMHEQWSRALGAVNRAEPGSGRAALYYRMVALDRQHLVVLGDPTVAPAAKPG